MDILYMDFPVSGVHTWVFLPPLVAFAVSFFSSMGGVSGAFFLLPYQVSFLNFVSPSVTSTNFVYNILAIPSGIYRYIREGRMAWPLAVVIVAGTLPGVFLGYYLRVLYLPDPRVFRLFVGCVLLYIASHLLIATFGKQRQKRLPGQDNPPGRKPDGSPETAPLQTSPKSFNDGRFRNTSGITKVETVCFSIRKIEYAFGGETFSVGTLGIFAVAFVVGIIGGAYGIGGGSILAPFCVAVYRLPVYTVAGAALLGTFLTSIAGTVFYSVIPSHSGVSTAPDWLLGALFGFGGILGMYCGARLQKYVPQVFIKAILALIMLFISCRYIMDYFGY
jgi:uncharacterized membrane protein YfcA